MDARAFSSPSQYDKRPWGRGCLISAFLSQREQCLLESLPKDAKGLQIGFCSYGFLFSSILIVLS